MELRANFRVRSGDNYTAVIGNVNGESFDVSVKDEAEAEKFINKKVAGGIKQMKAAHKEGEGE